MRPCLRKRNLRRLLKVARAGRIVQHSVNPFRHLELCATLENIDPGLPPDAFRWLGALASVARGCVRQRLVGTITYPHLLPELMSVMADPKTPASVTAPSAWREALRSRGVRLRKSSLLRWWAHLGLLYAQGLRVALSRTWNVFTDRLPRAPHDEYAVLMHLTPNLTPRGETLGFDFVSWYLQSSIRDPRIRQTWAHVNKSSARCLIPSITITTEYLPSLNNYWHKIRFLRRLVWAVASSTFRGLAGQWWEIVLLEQLTDFVYARELSNGDFARAYVFNNARFITRPLWTYVAENAGATVALVFYSTNIQTFGVTRRQPRPFSPGYRGMTWQQYIVWDEIQGEFLRELGLAAPAIIGGSDRIC